MLHRLPHVPTEEGLDQAFNSLDAQQEACAAYITSQRHEGWTQVKTHYADGGFSGGNIERPALRRLLDDVKAGVVDVIVVYKVDRLTRSLSDFAKIVDILDSRGASFVSVTQSFNTTTSMGRLTLNVLLSFAQFEREVTGERIRDKFAASKRKGMWMGGVVPLGYKVEGRKLVIVEEDAAIVRHIFTRYAELGSGRLLVEELRAEGYRTKVRQLKTRTVGGIPFGFGNTRLGLNVQPPRFHYGVRICPEPDYWGGLSGCTYQEGISWGKFVPPAEGGRFAEVLSDATLVWPLLMVGLLERIPAKSVPA